MPMTFEKTRILFTMLKYYGKQYFVLYFTKEFLLKTQGF